MQSKGIDVSSWQHANGAAIDWERVKGSGVTFVIVKLTQGTDYLNPFAIGPNANDIADAKAAGLVVGAYHFGMPGENEPDAEATWFLNHAETLDLEMGLWLDLEDLGGKQPHECVPWVNVFCDQIKSHNPVTGLYTDKTIWQAISMSVTVPKLWLANPTPQEGDPASYITQTGSGAVDGIAGAVDLDTLNVTRGVNPGGSAPPPPPPPPPPVAQPPTKPAPSAPTSPQEADVQVPDLSIQDPGPATVSEATRAVQALLVGKAGLSVGGSGIDGRFGGQTEAAVRTYQASHGLTTDGIVGPVTWEALCNR